MSPDWMNDAACKGYPTSWWYPDKPGRPTDTARAALAICDTCPVRRQCLDHAITNQEVYGLWGGEGVNGRDRHAHRTGRPRVNSSTYKLRSCGHGRGPDNPTISGGGRGGGVCLACRRQRDHEITWRINDGMTSAAIADDLGCNIATVAKAARRLGLGNQLNENRAERTRRSHVAHIIDTLRANGGDVRATVRATGALGATVARVADEHDLRPQPAQVTACPHCGWADGHSPRCQEAS